MLTERAATSSYYTYGDSAWGDLLTAYNGNAISYDTIGNPLSDGTWTYTWEHGRELASMYAEDTDGTDNEVTVSYTYNADGLRIRKTVTTKTYEAVQHTSNQTRIAREPLHTSLC